MQTVKEPVKSAVTEMTIDIYLLLVGSPLWLQLLVRSKRYLSSGVSQRKDFDSGHEELQQLKFWSFFYETFTTCVWNWLFHWTGSVLVGCERFSGFLYKLKSWVRLLWAMSSCQSLQFEVFLQHIGIKDLSLNKFLGMHYCTTRYSTLCVVVVTLNAHRTALLSPDQYGEAPE